MRISSIFYIAEEISATQTVPREYSHLAKHQVALRKLYEHLFCTKSIIKLNLKLLDLYFGIGEFEQSLVVLCYSSVSET